MPPKVKPSAKERPSNQMSLNFFVTGGKKTPEQSDSERAGPSSSTSPKKAKSKAKTSTRPKGQKSIKSFLPKEGDGSDSEDGMAEDTLPPIVKIPDIFADMVKRVPKLKGVAEQLKGHKIRVATMCSGTESPLLALDLIQQSILDQHNLKLDIEHVFSCEIEPFKQAYIERNFRPPLLFRDVCELGNENATTAYGARVRVPGDVDLLVAGTSCVDFSNLNKSKKTIAARGQSGRTFSGMLAWVDNHRPPAVILENVQSAPWKEIVAKFKDIGYTASHVLRDTKKYYIPHTRNRGYLLAVNTKVSDIPKRWVAMMKELERPATSSLDEWLLPSDDPRIHFYRQKLVKEGSGRERRTGRIDWARCESRHQRARLEEDLGQKRPLTNWEEGGLCKMPEYSWHDWGRTQVERVWDLLDILTLRAAVSGYDPAYKTQVWNLSQNVDRDAGNTKQFNKTPCLTPSMIPYVTSRGGPLVGVEALGLQGLPTDSLILTRETEAQLADLAGNAMSTTVVGSAIIAALVLCKDLLRHHGDHGSSDRKDESEAGPAEMTSPMDIDLPVEDNIPVASHITGDETLVEQPLELMPNDDRSMAELLAEAQHSVRLCPCEGRDGVTERDIWVCESCGSSACAKCRGRPEHEYPEQPLNTAEHPRLSPRAFGKELKAALPMSLRLEGIDESLMDELKVGHDGIDTRLWGRWRAAVLRTAEHELRFVELKRQEDWTGIYESSTARLELAVLPGQAEWTLYAMPSAKEPAKSAVRAALEAPVARMLCGAGWLSGAWEFSIPEKTTIAVDIAGEGEKVPAWEVILGLQSEQMKDKTVYPRLRISISPGDATKLDRDISGEYELLDKCGTACHALHKRHVSDVEADGRPVFLLFDPTRVGPPDQDAFAFSLSRRRYEFEETRQVLCRLEAEWRPSEVKDEPSTVKCIVPSTWKNAAGVALKASAVVGAVVGSPDNVFEVSEAPEACLAATAFLVCRVPLKGHAVLEWPRGDFWEVDAVHERQTFRSIAWLLDRVQDIGSQFREWQSCDSCGDLRLCTRCAPTKPSLEWKEIKGKIRAFEHPVQAGVYERLLKHRPAPFVAQLRLDEDEVGTVRIGVNFLSLMHRALSCLPSEGRAEPATISWRIDTHFIPAAKLSVDKYSLLSNRPDPEHAQPDFKVPLRPEQLRSLGWMVRQEAIDCPPFVEEEISEALLTALGWRAEGRAQRRHRVRGGVLADEVGYGKTVITLGLIESTRADVEREFNTEEANAPMKGKIHVKATLIVVPGHLTGQWKSEIEKFVTAQLKVVVIGMMDSLNQTTIKKIMKADIVIIASTIFDSDIYLENLEALAAVGDLPSAEGRYFETRLAEVYRSLEVQVDRLRNQGAGAVMEEIRQGKKRGHAVSSSQRGDADRNEHGAKEKGKGKANSVAESEHNSVPSLLASASHSDGDVSALEANTSAAEEAAGEDEAGEDEAGEDEAGEDEVGHEEEAGEDEAGEDETGEDEAGENDEPECQASDSPRGQKRSHGGEKDQERPAKKHKGRVDSDPWKLTSPAIETNWKLMQSPPIQMFHFARKVVDEYTYISGKVHSLITGITADRHWVLSGTPPVHDFAAVKTIAAFLDAHLGIDDAGEGISAQVKRRAAEQTAAERFHSFREVPSVEWHTHRHHVAQRFLNQYVRQNMAEIDEIPWTIHEKHITLPAAERAIYLELDHYLRSLDMTVKRTRKSESDREKRLNESLGDSKSAEEALLKRCSHFQLEDTDKQNARQACDVIVSDREKQREECKKDLAKHLEDALEKEQKIHGVAAESLFREHVRVCTSDGVGDAEATEIFMELMREAGIEAPSAPSHTLTNKPAPRAKGAKGKGKADDGMSQEDKDHVWELREHAHNLRRVTKELVARVRSLRYFTAVRNIQKQSALLVECPKCHRSLSNVSLDKVGLLSSCGHMGCLGCVTNSANQEECVCANPGPLGCKAAARRWNIIVGDTLGVDDDVRGPNDKHYGMKLEKIVDLIKNDIPVDERILVFVQFPDLMAKVAEALIASAVKFLEIKGTQRMRSKNLERFQQNSNERVLLLNVMDESASGANLTSANHVIFVSPLLANSQEQYDACETQAIGRVRRYGQMKHVLIYRFLTENTIDMEIYEQRCAVHGRVSEQM